MLDSLTSTMYKELSKFNSERASTEWKTANMHSQYVNMWTTCPSFLLYMLVYHRPGARDMTYHSELCVPHRCWSWSPTTTVAYIVYIVYIRYIYITYIEARINGTEISWIILNRATLLDHFLKHRGNPLQSPQPSYVEREPLPSPSLDSLSHEEGK